MNTVKKEIKIPELEPGDFGNDHKTNVKPDDDLLLTEDLREALPEYFQNYLKYASPLTDAPDEFLLASFMTSFSAAIGNKRFVQRGGFKIYPVIWTVLFAGSSISRKSTSINKALQPFGPLIDKLNESYNDNCIQYEEEKKSLPPDQAKELNKPKRNEIFSPEGFSDLIFWELMADNKGLLAKSSEFTAIFSEWTRSYTQIADLMLDVFDCKDYLVRNSKTGGRIEMKNGFLSLISATTLDNFRHTFSDQQKGSGLLQRILPVCITNRTKPEQKLTHSKTPDKELLNILSDTVCEMYYLKGNRGIGIQPDAVDHYDKAIDEIYLKRDNLRKKLPTIGGFVSRLEAYILKFALIFELTADSDSRSITKQSMIPACMLGGWFLKHITYMLTDNYVFDPLYAKRLQLRELLARNNGKMNHTNLSQNIKWNKKTLNMVLDSEIDAGYVNKTETETGGQRKLREYSLK